MPGPPALKIYMLLNAAMKRGGAVCEKAAG